MRIYTRTHTHEGHKKMKASLNSEAVNTASVGVCLYCICVCFI